MKDKHSCDKSSGKSSCDCKERVFDEFLDDIENDIKMEKYQQLWNKHGKLILIFATVVLAGVVLFPCWQGYDKEQREEISASLVNAQNLMEQGKIEEAVGLMTHIGARYQKTYKFLGKLSQAAILTSSDFSKNSEEIQGIYLSVLNNSAPEYIKELAAVLYVNAKLQRLSELDDAQGKELRDVLLKHRVSKNGIALMSKELEGIIAFKTKDYAAARKAFDEISKNENTPQGMHARISIMIQAIQDQGDGDAAVGGGTSSGGGTSVGGGNVPGGSDASVSGASVAENTSDKKPA
ncbi:MAG: tetratricopeptide repeat protein [Holosporales bacterium]|jgi:hypothetical protein|nr:tetratricopeptide repeat protein [Holosporales bacterium]